MRILVVSNLYPPHFVGGYELRCREVTEALSRRGHALRVLTSDHVAAGVAPGDPAGSTPVEITRSLRLHGFFGHPWLGIRALRGLEFHNHRVLAQALAEFKPDVVHVWNLGGNSKSLCLALERAGVPVVYDVSDHWIARSLAADVWLDWWNRPQPSPSARVLRSLWTMTGARRRWSTLAPTDPVSAIAFRRIYFCSRALRTLTAARGYPAGHAGIIHCGVDTGRFRGEPAPATQPLRRWLYVGRLEEDKGVKTALRAVAAVRDRFPGELHLYGRGNPEYTHSLQAFAQAECLPVSFHTAPAAEMPAVYRAHDALLFTSEWEEPFALTPLEAMASGLPVIGTTTGGSIELLRHRENCLTYTAGQPEELSRRILELDADPQLRARLAAAGQAEVRAGFHQGRIVDQIEGYLSESLGVK